MDDTLISSEVIFDRPGKQTGFLRVPYSVHRSANGWITVPISVLAGGDGPTVLLMAGSDGDECEGQIALTNLVRELEPEDIRGRIIILTMANSPAAEAGLRISSTDDGNLNRAFPGDRRGGPTDMIAHYIEHVLMPMADFMVDLHSGGTSLFNPPTLLHGTGHDGAEAERLKRLQTAFDLPYAWVFTGGGGSVDRDILAQTERGLRRVLHALGVLPGYVPDTAHGTRETNARGSACAYEAGLFEPIKEIAETVAEREVVGHAQHPETPWKSPDPVAAPYAGIVLAKRSLGQVRRGVAVFQIAADMVPV